MSDANTTIKTEEGVTLYPIPAVGSYAGLDADGTLVYCPMLSDGSPELTRGRVEASAVEEVDSTLLESLSASKDKEHAAMYQAACKLPRADGS